MRRRWQGDKITAKHIRKAANLWSKDPRAMGFGSSTKYDVYIDGKPFPPKAISALAYKLATGETLKPQDFPGALDGYWHGILKKFFPIWPKSSVFTSEEELDAKTKSLSGLTYEQIVALADETSSEAPHSEVVTTRIDVRTVSDEMFDNLLTDVASGAGYEDRRCGHISL